jgi:hypothetical protein|tara:strand:+ start:1469 stop:1642 length:174 start_codon:yes stop_codon:yes gene_type:complete
MRRKKQDNYSIEDLVMTKKLTVDYDQKYDNCQDNEDEWVSSVLGTEDDAIYDVLDQL